MIWYPYEQMKTMKEPWKIVDAEGVWLDTGEKKLIDSVSSWWSVIHGYKHPKLNQAIISQAEKFSHVMLGGLTHEPVQKLSEKLQSWLPGDLDYSFFSDSGSVAVEVALKMALQYYINRGEEQRTMVLALEHAYHGDTFKTMEVGDDEDYHFVLKAYGASPYVVHIPTEEKALEEAFSRYHDRLNCLLVEPLLQGAGGMRMYDVSFLRRARKLCDQYGVLLIFDEVATGFGRTGNRFVADLVLPDILVLGKALTGGYIGHAVTVANRKVFEGFYDDNPEHALMHGPTFMGNALACRVALQSIEIFEKQDYMSKIRRIEEITRRELEGFSDPRIEEVRIMGGCACIEVKDSAVLKGYQQFAFERGVFARPFLKYLYAMVPYVIEEDELVQVLGCMKEWFERKR
ncbi:adenosylmethionine--8-amino-7-oxononanoate transaminase [Clostridiaceae bacterium]|nr:adenosylmethionine--8-amino-7-oxononanoate transaminase [Clostridiaceae bacterium]RKI10929.1 adenosylmethionine--8-amino-7-oxononanoate transaminase [bacterium 1XD21-70]